MRIGKLIVLLAMLLLFVGIVAAQDDVEVATYAEDTAGVMVISLTEAAFTTGEDGTVSLSFLADAEFASVFISAPNVLLQNYNLIDLSDDWTFAEELSVLGAIQSDEYMISLSLSAPSFDVESNSLSFVVSDAAALELATNKEGSLPELVEAASLYIRLDAAFLNGLALGHAAALAERRATSIGNPCPCDPDW